jgi:Fic-DOC domain mobile mystery protein B
LQGELNEWEQANILEAEKWIFSQKHKDIFSLEFIQGLHEKMLGETWKWAGKFRKTQKSIGVDHFEIPQELLKCCKDTLYQKDNHVYPLDEIAARLHHRLVWILPFPNGNGRHARIFTDIFLIQLQQSKFTRGRGDLANLTDLRKTYIAALRAADNYNFEPLLKFIRS